MLSREKYYSLENKPRNKRTELKFGGVENFLLAKYEHQG